jgi:hypothetical protein
MTKEEIIITAALVLIVLLGFALVLYRDMEKQRKRHWNNHDWPCPSCGKRTGIMALNDFGACVDCMEMQDGTCGMG